jgi:hypothetical protein
VYVVRVEEGLTVHFKFLACFNTSFNLSNFVLLATMVDIIPILIPRRKRRSISLGESDYS